MSQEATKIVKTEHNEALNQDNNYGNRKEETRSEIRAEWTHLNNLWAGHQERNFGLLRFCLLQLSKIAMRMGLVGWKEGDKFIFGCVQFEMLKHPD